MGRSVVKFPANPPEGAVKLAAFPLKATSEMHVALSQGYQNLPKLYGDTDIRKAGKVTGLGSGLKEAAKGFTLGLADAGRGIFEQPYLGAQKEVRFQMVILISGSYGIYERCCKGDCWNVR